MLFQVTNEKGVSVCFDFGDESLESMKTPHARDWATFFASLASFFEVVFPIIAPYLFTESE